MTSVEGRPLTAEATLARAGGAPPKIELRQIQKQFVVRKQIVEAVQKTTIAIPDGQFTCLLGPSGCGKTTLLRIVAGLETPTSGTVHVERTGANRPLNALIFQQESLFPWKTVWENVEFALKMRGIDRAERRERTES